MKLTLAVFFLVFLAGFFACDKVELNKVPTADAGPAQIIQSPKDSTTLTGTGTDVDGTIEGYLWSQVSGPSIPDIFTPGDATTKIGELVPGSYLFQLMVVDDDGATGLDTVSVTVLPSVIKTVTIQPGPTDGEDARLTAVQNCDASSPIINAGNNNAPSYPDMPIVAWTNNANGCATMQHRAFIRFTELNNIPKNATIISAKLTLYGASSSESMPEGNSYYPGSPYNSSGTNECWLKQVTGSWSEGLITWNNQPTVTETNRAAIPASTSKWNFDAPNIDVTEMVKDMVNNDKNYGFCIMLQNETYYRAVAFASSDNTNAAKRPKLVVVYQE
jgi:hypothetical protein